MNNIGKLIKAKTISFNDILIKNYYKMNLNEVEAMILMILYNQQEEGNSFLSIKELKKKVTISEEDLSSYVMLLVQKGMIELVIDEEEKFNLDQVMDKLGDLLESDKTTDNNYNQAIDVNEIVNYVERVYARPLSPADLLIINNWVSFGYGLENIKKAINESLKAKRIHLKYADAILANQRQTRTTRVADDEIKQMLESVYVKKY